MPITKEKAISNKIKLLFLKTIFKDVLKESFFVSAAKLKKRNEILLFLKKKSIGTLEELEAFLEKTKIQVLLKQLP